MGFFKRGLIGKITGHQHREHKREAVEKGKAQATATVNNQAEAAQAAVRDQVNQRLDQLRQAQAQSHLELQAWRSREEGEAQILYENQQADLSKAQGDLEKGHQERLAELDQWQSIQAEGLQAKRQDLLKAVQGHQQAGNARFEEHRSRQAQESTEVQDWGETLGQQVQAEQASRQVLLSTLFTPARAVSEKIRAYSELKAHLEFLESSAEITRASLESQSQFLHRVGPLALISTPMSQRPWPPKQI